MGVIITTSLSNKPRVHHSLTLALVPPKVPQKKTITHKNKGQQPQATSNKQQATSNKQTTTTKNKKLWVVP
jgi:hypothetical protein